MLRLITGFLAGLCIGLCHAQDDTIVITATRFPDSKRDLPVGVTVITADDIRNSASSNLGDILAQFGLLQIRDLAGTQNPQLDLRGFGITGDQNTLVLLDGLRITESDFESAQLSAIPLDSIERIEIVRGGGAVLYGAGATGGTINIITRRARPGEVRALALARAGGYGTDEVRGSYGRQGDVFGGGVAASYEDTDGYRANSRYRQRSAMGRVDALFPTGRAYLKLGVDEQRQRLPGALTEAEINADPRQTRTPNDWRERDGAQVSLGGTQRSGGHELSADLGYRQRTTKAFFAAFGGFFTDTDASLWSFTPRAKLACAALGRTQELIVGADFERWDYDTLSASSPATTAAPFSRRRGEQDNVGWYAQTNFWVAPRTRAVLSARTQRIAQRLTEEVFPLDERRSAARLEAYDAALRHNFATGWSVYGKYEKSFRVANFERTRASSHPARPPCSSRRRRTAPMSAWSTKAQRCARAPPSTTFGSTMKSTSARSRFRISTCRRRSAAGWSWRPCGARRRRSTCARGSRCRRRASGRACMAASMSAARRCRSCRKCSSRPAPHGHSRRAAASTSTCATSDASASTTIRRTASRGRCPSTRWPTPSSSSASRAAGTSRSR